MAIKQPIHTESWSAFSYHKMQPRTKEEGAEKVTFYISSMLGLCPSPVQCKWTQFRRVSPIHHGFEWLVISQSSAVLCPVPLSHSREWRGIILPDPCCILLVRGIPHSQPWGSSPALSHHKESYTRAQKWGHPSLWPTFVQRNMTNFWILCLTGIWSHLPSMDSAF